MVFCVLFALPFIGIRVLYSLVALCTRKSYLNPVTGSITIRVLLGFLPELIPTIMFIAVGIATQNIRKVSGEKRDNGEFRQSSEEIGV